MNKFTFLIFFFVYNFISSQEHLSLSPEEKAYFFHVVRKSPILELNIGRYFEYKGPDIRFLTKEINYDSIESIIISNPELLQIRSIEIAKSPKGIVSELTNKVALWELNKLLQAKRTSSKELEPYLVNYLRFENLLLSKLPSEAYKNEDGKIIPHPKLHDLLNPTLNFTDKRALLSTFHSLDLSNQLQTMKAMNYAINAYVEMRSLELFKALGADADYYKNVLVAAGDGSSTSGLLEEREKDEKGRWNRGLPKAVGLFPYQIEIKPGDKKTKPAIEPLRYAVMDFETIGKNRITNIHCDVWGYNATKQTTVVIEKNGVSYHLFGSEETRFLTPDSSFAKGSTFQAVINDLEFNKIAKLDEMIHGKKGFDYWIAYNTKKKDETALEIEKQEKNYSDMGYKPITTSKKPSREVRKSRKKLYKKGGGAASYQPTTYSGKQKKKSKQQEIVDLYNLFEDYKKKIADLKKQKEEVVETRARYQGRLDHFKQLMGLHWATFKVKDGLYTFQDSATFDIYTQEFTFPASQEKTLFEVKLLSIPSNGLSDIADEVMMHVNVTDANPKFNARVQVHLEDVFASDKWNLNETLLLEKDSVAVTQFFEAIMQKKNKFTITARGQGVGYWDSTRVIKNTDPKFQELLSYPGSSADEKTKNRNDIAFARLRKSEVLIDLDRGVELEINSYTDPVGSNLIVINPILLKAITQFKLSKNEILSAYRSAAILFKLKEELNLLAGKYYPKDQAKKVIDRLNNQIKKVQIQVGKTSIELDAFK